MWSVVFKEWKQPPLHSQQHNAVNSLNDPALWDDCVKPRETLGVRGFSVFN